MKSIVLFGGTSEGRQLAEALAGPQTHLTVCVATDYGRDLLPPENESLNILRGRMDAQEMAALFAREGCAYVVDATHPYAVEVTRNIRQAAQQAGVRLLRVQRAPGGAHDCIYAHDAAQAAALAAQMPGNVLLTTGAKDLPVFAAQPGLRDRLYARVLPSEESIRRCLDCGLARAHIIAMQGPFGQKLNEALMEQLSIACMVTKDGGAAGGFEEKMRAAETLGVRVVVIGRPEEDEGWTVGQVLEIIKREDGKPCR